MSFILLLKIIDLTSTLDKIEDMLTVIGLTLGSDAIVTKCGTLGTCTRVTVPVPLSVAYPGFEEGRC